MKTYFLNPPFLPRYSRQSRSPSITKSNTLYFPYYLAYAAGAAEKAGHDVKLADAIANQWSLEQTIENVKSFNPKLIVIDTSTASIYNDTGLGKRLMEVLPNAHVTLTGTFPTKMTEYALNLNGSHSVCVGEYDYTARDLATALEKGKPIDSVPGLAYLDKQGKAVSTGEAQLVKNLDDLPWASKIYLKHFGRKGIGQYFYASVTWPELMLLTARGCPWNCSFCNIPLKQSYRMRSVKDVADEFEFIQKEMPWVNEIMVEDDTFPVVRKRTIELCDELIQRGIKLKWSCNARVTTDLDSMKKMRQAGCRLMCVGFESASQEVLDSIQKRSVMQRQYDFMKEAKQVGIKVNGCFIFGLPGDTPETMRKTIEMAKRLNPNTAQFYPLQAYPGQESYDWAKKNGYLVTEDFRQWITEEGMHTTTVRQPGLEPEEVLKWCNRARLEFYTSPKFIAKMIPQALGDPAEAVRMAKAGRVLFKHLATYVVSDKARVVEKKAKV